MEPLSIDEILDETNQIDISARQKHWLTTEVCSFFVNNNNNNNLVSYPREFSTES